jgi:hypothetical protein
MNKLDKEKLPYKYQDMIEELTEDTVKFFYSHTIYKVKSQTELLRVARQFHYEKCLKQANEPKRRKIYLELKQHHQRHQTFMNNKTFKYFIIKNHQIIVCYLRIKYTIIFLRKYLLEK